jgi:hypothetical protein
VPVEDGTGTTVVSPAAGTLRDEMAVSGQRLLATSGQIPMAAHSLRWLGLAVLADAAEGTEVALRAVPRARPLLDFRAQPEQATARTKIQHGLREVGVSSTVGPHAVALAQSEDLGDARGVGDVVEVDGPSHGRDGSCDA